jgi:beta-N-acetylhexosaminidase
VFGCAGPTLTDDERRFFESADPLGFILFRRNIENPEQVRSLVAGLRESVGRLDAPVLIDQEGGRVARLSPPHWSALPPARAIGLLAERNRDAGIEAAKATGRVIGAMLADLNIDVACAPVADLLLPETHGVIGDRAYSDDPVLVSIMAKAVCGGLADAGVTPIVKHIPGHGRATADSHLALPRIAASRIELESADFVAFQNAPDTAWAMVAHCVYTAFDEDRAASISPVVISEAIRGSIGFEGLLIADDIGMKALSGALADNAVATLAAGCDVTLHCSGDLAEMTRIAPVVSQLSDAAADRLKRSKENVRAAKKHIDVAAERARLGAWAPV